MKKNQYQDKKSLRLCTKNSPDWKSLAKDCVRFANSRGDTIAISIEDNSDTPPENQRILAELPELIRKRNKNHKLNFISPIK